MPHTTGTRCLFILGTVAPEPTTDACADAITAATILREAYGLDVTVGQIRVWGTRGLITRAGYDPHIGRRPVALYSMRDIYRRATRNHSLPPDTDTM